MQAEQPVLDVAGVHAGYGDALILHGVSIKVAARTVVTVMGPNGSGKSTLLKTIFGLTKRTSGTITLRDEAGRSVDISQAQPYALPALGVSYVPQLANVFVDMSVLENLQMGALPLPRRGRAARARIDEVLDGFPAIRSKLLARAGTLSGGQRQMLAMARALVPRPRLLILDEPSAGLAPNTASEVFDQIQGVRDRGVSILIVEQKARQSLAISDYAYVLEMGSNRREGSAEDILHDPEVIDLYLGGRGIRTSRRPSADAEA